MPNPSDIGQECPRSGSWEVAVSFRTCSPAMNLTLLEITGRPKRCLSLLLLLCVLRGSARALVRLHKKKPGRAQSRRGRGGKTAAEPRMDTVGKPAGVGPRIAPLLGVFKGPLLETGIPSGTRGAKATAIARMRLRFRGSCIFRFELLTGLEPHDWSAGHRPGQLASNRIHRAEAVLGAPVHGKFPRPFGLAHGP